jgi:hypothetical protein
MSKIVDSENAFRWVKGDKAPYVKWDALYRWLDKEGKLRRPTDIPKMGELNRSVQQDGFILLGNDDGEAVFVQGRSFDRDIRNLQELLDQGFIARDILEEINRQVETATEKRDADYLEMYEKEAIEVVRKSCFSQPLLRLSAVVQSIGSIYLIAKISDQDFAERITAIREATDELERLQKLSDRQLFDELLVSTIARIKASFGSDPEANPRLATLNQVTTPLELNAYFKEWEY